MELDLEVATKFGFATGKDVSDASDRLIDWMEGNTSARPNFYNLSVATQNVANQVVSLGSPPIGRIWNVLGISCCGQDDATQSTVGTVGFYVGNAPATGVPTLSQLRYPRITLPFTFSWGADVVWCSSGNELFFNLVGLATVTSFVGNAWVAEYREDELLMRSGR